ncbi:MAG: hypothetical protein V2I36_04945 [Desulfopila sp.]|nr:hypothetical protein [Desulfopila sp.]
MSASVAFCSFVGKRLGDHLAESGRVCTDILAPDPRGALRG